VSLGSDALLLILIHFLSSLISLWDLWGNLSGELTLFWFGHSILGHFHSRNYSSLLNQGGSFLRLIPFWRNLVLIPGNSFLKVGPFLEKPFFLFKEIPSFRLSIWGLPGFWLGHSWLIIPLEDYQANLAWKSFPLSFDGKLFVLSFKNP